MINNDPPAHVGPRLYWLDWARFLAAFVVVMAHARAETWVPWGVLQEGERTFAALVLFTLSRFGHEAVVIFFVLSGFFVGGKVLDMVKTQRHEALRAFVIDRFVRIYLPLLPCLILTLAVGWAVFNDSQPAEVLGSLFGVQGILTKMPAANVSLWSLSYEIWFYTLGGAALAVLSPIPSVRMTGWLLLTISMGVYAELNPMYLLCWALGAIGWIMMRKNIQPGILWLAGAVALGGFVLNIWADLAHQSKESVARLGALAVMSAGIAPLLGFVGKAKPSGVLVLFEKQGARFASFSYTLYLAHYPVYILMGKWLPGPSAIVDSASLVGFVIRIAAALVASYLLYLLFERHTFRVKAYFKGKWA